MLLRLLQSAKSLFVETDEEKSYPSQDTPPSASPKSFNEGSLLDVIRKLGILTEEDLAERPVTRKPDGSLPNDKKLENMDVKATLEHADASGDFSHLVLRVNKKGKDDVWFVKWIFAADDSNVNRDVAERETVANEYLRLLMPWQPKTRTLVDNDGEVCVMSKGVKGFIPCEDNTYNLKFIAETYVEMQLSCGAGELLVAAMMADEIDFRFPNMGFDENGHLTKIDGDRCFARFWDKTRTPSVITAKDLNNLPFVTDYKPSNWFNIILSEKAMPDSEMPSVVFQLVNNPLFRREINRGILKNLLLDDNLLRHFFGTYVSDPTHSDALRKDIIDRRDQLQTAALQNVSFQTYLQSPDAADDLQQFKKQLGEFKTTGKKFLLTETNKAEFTQTIDSKFENLVKDIAVVNAQSSSAAAASQTVFRK
jgi:hypothetical protein